VVGEAGSARSAKRLDLELLPDVVVLDLLLPQAMEGMDVLWELRGRGRPVVALSCLGELGPEAVGAGAHAFLEKHGRDVDDLLDMIRAATATIPGHEAGEADASTGRVVRLGSRTAVPFFNGPAQTLEA